MTVKQVQHLLGYLGYYTGLPDGSWGRLSEEAAVAFQREYGLEPDGIVGQATEQALRGAVAGTIDKVQEADPEEAVDGWWKDIRYFTRAEFKCKCGGRFCNGYPAEMREAVVKIADAAREHFGKPAYVVSGLRCKTWNGMQGGVANSQHMYGEACDLCVDGVGWSELLAYIKTIQGVRYAYHIEGSNNIHFDINKVGR